MDHGPNPSSAGRRHLLGMLLASAGALTWHGRSAEGAAPPEPAPGGASQASDISQAEHLLFLLPHLANVNPPRTLRYRYVRDGAPGGRFEDRVTLVLEAGTDAACCSVHGEYLSGAQRLSLPDISNARANPVLLYFLEHQVRQLQQRTGGTQNHFRSMTRRALANAPAPVPGTLRWRGADVPSRTVRVAPYLDDPYRERFAADARTEYSFVVSEAVPGMLYELRAAIPGTPPGRVEVLTFEGDEAPTPDKR